MTITFSYICIGTYLCRIASHLFCITSHHIATHRCSFLVNLHLRLSRLHPAQSACPPHSSESSFTWKKRIVTRCPVVLLTDQLLAKSKCVLLAKIELGEAVFFSLCLPPSCHLEQHAIYTSRSLHPISVCTYLISFPFCFTARISSSETRHTYIHSTSQTPFYPQTAPQTPAHFQPSHPSTQRLVLYLREVSWLSMSGCNTASIPPVCTCPPCKPRYHLQCQPLRNYIHLCLCKVPFYPLPLHYIIPHSLTHRNGALALSETLTDWVPRTPESVCTSLFPSPVLIFN